MSFDYIAYRRTRRTGRYKLQRRMEKILGLIKNFKNQCRVSVLDVGAADGYMLNEFKNKIDVELCLGIETCLDFIKSNSEGTCQIIEAKGEQIPFKDELFDVVTAASVFDHMQEPSLFLKDCRRVLKEKGIVVISLVSPFYDKLAVKFRIKDDDHVFHWTARQLKELLNSEGFDVIEISRFALPFFGIFFEQFIEKSLRAIGIDWLMFYIVVVGRKS